MEKSIINNTGKAIVAITLMLFCLGTIVWLLIEGQPGNSLHASALSWSYTVLVVAAAALGLDVAIAKILPALVTPSAPK
jgi:hypothetical protein